MRVQILGSGGYFPNEQRHTACYLLPDVGAVLDAGTGTFRLLSRLPGREIDLFLTHAHLDHIVGLTYLLLPLTLGELDAVRVHGTEQTLAAVKTHLFSEPVFPVMPKFEYRPLIEGQAVALLGGAVLRHLKVSTHPGGTVLYRIDCPGSDAQPASSLAYVTDTSVNDSYFDFIRGVDVLLHECYFRDSESEWADMTGHSHTTPVAEMARGLGVGSLYLIHLDPQRRDGDQEEVQVARSIFPETRLATDLMEIDGRRGPVPLQPAGQGMTRISGLSEDLGR